MEREFKINRHMSQQKQARVNLFNNEFLFPSKFDKRGMYSLHHNQTLLRCFYLSIVNSQEKSRILHNLRVSSDEYHAKRIYTDEELERIQNLKKKTSREKDLESELIEK